MKIMWREIGANVKITLIVIAILTLWVVNIGVKCYVSTMIAVQ